MNEQQNKAKQKHKNNSPHHSQDLNTYDFGNFENWKLKSEII